MRDSMGSEIRWGQLLAQRLRVAGAYVRLDATESILESLFFIHRMSLRAQMSAEAPGEAVNRLYPDSLNDIDRQLLKETFKQARKLGGASGQFSLSPERL
jgi:CBS domain-containing protein